MPRTQANTTVEFDTQVQVASEVCQHDCTILDHNGWNMVEEPVVEKQGEGAGGPSIHQQESISHACVAQHEFVGKCGITNILTALMTPRDTQEVLETQSDEIQRVIRQRHSKHFLERGVVKLPESGAARRLENSRVVLKCDPVSCHH